MADAFVQILLENLNSLIRKELGLLWGVDKEMKRLSSLLSTIQAVVEDAEEKQVKDKAVQNWLRKLKDAAYKVDDILDECATEASRLEFGGRNGTLMNKVNTSFLNRFGPFNILFCRKMANRMREIRERIDEIAEERKKFHLNEVVAEKRGEVIEGRQTGSIITQPKVYGRDEDQEKIVEYLVKHVACCDEISVYPIVGIGGLGKTTIAQTAFNDERVKSHFELRIWVCISMDFDLRRVIKAIIESATGFACEALELEPLQIRLQDILKWKRYLLVLDDVWNEDQENWDRLKYVLACGSKGASIIVTTRIKRVASIMGTLPLHTLSNLTEDDCWSLFKERAFGHEREEHPNFVAIGKEIVKKCGGVPLAVKSLGGLMRYKSEEKEWLSVKDCELWELPQDENSILPSLRLSYFNLPSRMRQCFAYCAIFPKDFVIERENLIHLWMANGLLSSSQKLEPEDIGNDICNELSWRSFLEKESWGYPVRFKMHDLVHDLAQSIMEDECLIMEAGSSDNISKRVVHVSLETDWRQSYCISKSLYAVETLRTVIMQPMRSRCSGKWNAVKFACDFSRLSSLRAFDAQSTGLVKLSSSISHLKHLRYLDLSSSCIQKLPESICSLLNLQTLKLKRCLYLRELPQHMRQLKNLRHLYLNYCDSLFQMPPKIGQIKCLKTLTLFIADEIRGCHLSELKGLNLEGELHIKQLNKVRNPMDAKEANMVQKRNLRSLYLSWGHDSELEQQENAEKVLEALEPHPNLEHLVINGYKGAQFPPWTGDQIFSSIVSVTLSKCENSIQLPLLGQLPSLRYLEVSKINHVLYIDHDFQNGGTMGRFPSLERLSMRDLPSLQRLSREDGRDIFPYLTNLTIINCPKLSLPCLPSVKNLTVWRCSNVLLRSISNLRSLTGLSIDDNDESIEFPHGMIQNTTSLSSLYIRNFSKLKLFLTEQVSLNDLKSLSISECHELEYIPEQGLKGLYSLQRLNLYDCRKFRSLSEGLQHLSSLETLILNGCPELFNLPDDIKHLSSLQVLTISGKPTVIDGFSPGNPTGLHKLMVSSFSHEQPIACPKLAVLPEVLRYASALQSLCISCYPDLASLPRWLGNLTSLHSLQIFDCPKLSTLPESIQCLTLQNLYISQCPELVKQCAKETGQDWCKIAHVPNVYLESSPPNVVQ